MMNPLAQVIPAEVAPLSGEDFEFFRREIHARAGIKLSPVKRDLVQTRLRHRVNALKFASFEEYRRHLGSLGQTDEEWQLFVNLLTTNKTDFFREPSHFELIAHTLAPLWEKRAKPVKVWSAASSTGEEPYSLAMTLDRHLGVPFEILASDIDTKVLATGANAVYPIHKLREIPPEMAEYATVGRDELKDWFRIHRRARAHVHFQSHNLLDTGSPGQAPFDLILCRNVMIYFDRPTIERVLENLFQAAQPGATLLIGHSESLQNIRTPWIYRRPSIYEKPGPR